MSAKMIQQKSGVRERMVRFAPGDFRLLRAALDLWCLRNGFPGALSMGEMIGADFAERHGGRGVAR